MICRHVPFNGGKSQIFSFPKVIAVKPIRKLLLGHPAIGKQGGLPKHLHHLQLFIGQGLSG